MRTFIAVPITEECRKMLDHMQQNLRSYGANVRWVAVSSIHLTLKFLGEVDPAIIPILAESLESAVQTHQSFEIRLRGLGCFPNQKNPRVVWCGIDGETESLSRLHQLVETACSSLGFVPEKRAFHPHLTLGRINGKRNLQPLLDCIKIGSDLECSFKADHFNIYRSTLRPQGAVYAVLKTIGLRD
jgi:2'-5' RNA ligase